MTSVHPTLPIAALTALALLTTPVFAQKQPDVRVNANPFGPGLVQASGPAIAAQDDEVFVAWVDARNGSQDIYFSKSSDRGATWLANDIRIDTDPAGSALSLQPVLATQGDNVYVVWVDYRNGGLIEADIYFSRSTDRGATWLMQDVRINTDALGMPGGQSVNPLLCASGSNVYVAWLDTRNDAGFDVYMNYSLDEGATWQANDIRVDTNNGPIGFVSSPAMCCSGSNVYVGWAELRDPLQAFDVYMNYSTDAGATWQPQDIRVDHASGDTTTSFVAMACEGDRVYAVWPDDRNTYTPRGGAPTRNPDLFFNYSTDNGATWQSTDTRLDTGDSPGASQSIFPQIHAQGMDLFVSWEDWRNGLVAPTTQADVFFNHSSDGGATWLSNDIQVSNAPVDGLDHSPAEPQMCVQGTDIFICWLDIRNGESDIYFNRSTDKGVTWLGNDVRMDTDMPGAAFSAEPKIACSGQQPFIVWTDDRIARAQMTTGTDIFFNVPFGAYDYGAGTAGTGSLTPALTSGGQPTIGNQFTIDVDSGVGGAPGALFLGVQPTTLPLLGGTILTLPVLNVPIFLNGTPGAAGAGAFSQPFNVPNNEAFVGAALYFQALILDMAAPEGLSMTNGVEVWMG